ncbi:MAG: class I SAM-dependent methyltransferase [Desulfovibrionaceae bacterium]
MSLYTFFSDIMTNRHLQFLKKFKAYQVIKNLLRPDQLPNIDDIIQRRTQACIDKTISASAHIKYETIVRSKKEFQDFCNQISHITNRDNILNTIVKTGFNFHYTYRGYCQVCQKDTFFDISLPWTTSTEGVGCPSCMLSSRMRLVFEIVLRYYKKDMAVYVSEQTTSFYSQLKKHIPNLIGSEFLPLEQRGGEIRHEDATNLSFANESIDLYISNDVLEHVHDYKKAFYEAYRVLKCGGKFIFHIPFYFLDKTVLRAIVDDHGEIIFIKDPIYHGNPLSPKGSLVFTDFGWDLFDFIKTINPKDLYIYMTNDIQSGYLHTTSFCFIMEK